MRVAYQVNVQRRRIATPSGAASRCIIRTNRRRGGLKRRERREEGGGQDGGSNAPHRSDRAAVTAAHRGGLVDRRINKLLPFRLGGHLGEFARRRPLEVETAEVVK